MPSIVISRVCLTRAPRHTPNASLSAASCASSTAYARAATELFPRPILVYVEHPYRDGKRECKMVAQPSSGAACDACTSVSLASRLPSDTNFSSLDASADCFSSTAD